MTDKEIKYKNFNKTSLIVFCEKDKYEKFMKNINGNWNGTAWIVPKKKEKEIKEFILENITTHIKSRKNQNKYHRELSESENYSDDESEKCSVSSDDSSDDNLSCVDSAEDTKKNDDKKKMLEKIKEEDKIKKQKYLKNDPMLYYKSFKTKPDNFKKINNILSSDESESIPSSSDNESSSSDDSFPEPKTPKKRKKYYNKKNETYDDLVDTVKSLQRKIYEIEIENKKLKSKI